MGIDNVDDMSQSFPSLLFIYEVRIEWRKAESQSPRHPVGSWAQGDLRKWKLRARPWEQMRSHACHKLLTAVEKAGARECNVKYLQARFPWKVSGS